MIPLVFRAPTQAKINKAQLKAQMIRRAIKYSIIGVIIVLAVLVINTYIISVTMVDGISMQPTLHTGNLLILWKFPVTWADITGQQYIPARGNIVIIKKSPVLQVDLVKRVIGLPGDYVKINNEVVTIYNSKHPNGFNPDNAPFGKHLSPTDGYFTTHVAAGYIFVMGDNRVAGASEDSRSSLGNIPYYHLQGKVLMRIFPFTELKLF